MTIQFSQDVPNIGGVNYTAGQTVTLNAQTEYRLVGLNLAAWVGSPPFIQEPGIGGGNVNAVTGPNGEVSGLQAGSSFIEKLPVAGSIPRGMSWLTDTINGFDIYSQGFVKRPTIFFDPTATTSKGLGTFSQPYNTVAQVVARCRGDMTKQVLGIKRGTKVSTGQAGMIFLGVNGSSADPFIICPYGDAEALPIITGAVVTPAGQWSVYSGNIYQISMTALQTAGLITDATKQMDLFQTDYQQNGSLNGARLFYQSSLGAVTGPGMAYYDSGTKVVYAWLYGNEVPSTQMEFAAPEFALQVLYSNIAATGNVSIVGMDVRKARNSAISIQAPPTFAAITSCAQLNVVGCVASGAGVNNAESVARDGIIVYGPNNIAATNSLIAANRIDDQLNNPIEVGFHNGLTIEYNYSTNSGGNAIAELWVNVQNSTIAKNLGIGVSNRLWVYNGGSQNGIWITPYADASLTVDTAGTAQGGNTIFGNMIVNARKVGISIEAGINNKVLNNTLYNIGNIGMDLGQYTVGANRNRSTFVNNNLVVMGQVDDKYTGNAMDFVQCAAAAGTATTDGAVVFTAPASQYIVQGDNNVYINSTFLGGPSPSYPMIRYHIGAGAVVSRFIGAPSDFTGYKTDMGTSVFDANAQTAVWATASPVDSDYRPTAGNIAIGAGSATPLAAGGVLAGDRLGKVWATVPAAGCMEQ